ncbi:unnamed protein product [Calypogeia fissa]
MILVGLARPLLLLALLVPPLFCCYCCYCCVCVRTAPGPGGPVLTSLLLYLRCYGGTAAADGWSAAGLAVVAATCFGWVAIANLHCYYCSYSDGQGEQKEEGEEEEGGELSNE